MGTALILIIAFVANFAYADGPLTCSIDGVDVSSDLQKIVAGVKAAKDCDKAYEFASACAWGSSADTQIAGAAADICSNEMKANKADAADHRLLTQLFNACIEKWGKKQGTLYISADAFCQLEAIKWMVGLTGANIEQP